MNWIFNETFKGTARLDRKTAIVTGCNSGIGKETAREFHKRGARVIMACRDVCKAEEAARDIRESAQGLSEVGTLIIRKLDLASLEDVRRCANQILDSEPAIHLLVNNAGIAACSRELSEDGFELQFQTNHLGHFLFTLLLLPRLIKSKPARIVNVSSVAHMFSDGKMHFDDINLDRTGYNRFLAYSRTKFANILFAKELGRRLAGTGVTAYSLHPGVVLTDIARHCVDDFPLIFKYILKVGQLLFKTPVQSAQTTLYCALDEKCADETGLYYMECEITFAFLGRNSDAKAKELWEESVKLVKLENVDVFTPA